jgi:hypothetical protein
MTVNFYCTCCLRTQAFVANERGFQCPICRKLLFRSDPPRRRTNEKPARTAATFRGIAQLPTSA